MWVLFPMWFAVTLEGFGLIDDALIINVGWAFLNISSKFSFIFHIQRIKDNYCSRTKIKHEAYGVKGLEAGGVVGGVLGHAEHAHRLHHHGSELATLGFLTFP